MRRYVRAYGATRAEAPMAPTIGPLSAKPRRGQREAEAEREPHARDSVLGGAFAIAGAQPAGDRGGGAVGEEVEDAEGHAEHGAGHAEPAERAGPEVAHDRGVGQHVQGLGRERAEGRDREAKDLAVVHGRRTLLSHRAYSIRLMDTAPPIRFAELARRIGAASRAAGLVVPAFRCPPRRSGVPRTIRRLPGGPVVAVRMRARPPNDVAVDMVEGVIVVQRADRCRGRAACANRCWLPSGSARPESGVRVRPVRSRPQPDPSDLPLRHPPGWRNWQT